MMLMHKVLTLLLLFMAPLVGAQPVVNSIAGYQQKLNEINHIQVYFDIGLNSQNPSWDLPRPLWPVLFERLSTLNEAHITDGIFDDFPSAVDNYQGLQLRFEVVENAPQQLPPLRIFYRAVFMPGQPVATDPGRLTEYWLFGTAPSEAIKVALVEALPVFTFEQCQLMGNPIVDTTPRQCILPDKSLILETFDEPTEHSLTVDNFYDCLQHGRALIDTFPRRCLLPGGRVLAEPPVTFDYYEQRAREQADEVLLVP